MSCAPMAADRDILDTSDDAILGGRLTLRQPLEGHRFGHDAILLAAATAGRAGELAVDLGAGVGAAGLALASRVSGLRLVLVEIDPVLSRLAADNAKRNKLDDRVRAITCDVEDRNTLAAAGLHGGSADRVLMNPPFHDARRHNVSPDARRRLAHASEPGLLARWLASAAWLLKPGGSLTLIWRADETDEVLAALKSGFGAITVLRVMPREDAAAIRVLVHAVNGEGGAATQRPPLVLNDVSGRPTAVAEAVLRGGQRLTLVED